MNFIENELPNKKSAHNDIPEKRNSDEEVIESESRNKVTNEKNIPGNDPSGKNTVTEESTWKHLLDKCGEERSQVSRQIYLQRFISCSQ